MIKQYNRIIALILLVVSVVSCYDFLIYTPRDAVSASSSGSSTSAAKKQYIDIKSSDWFYDDVIFLTEAKAINGYPDGSFRPDGYITCGEFTKLLFEAAQINVSSIPYYSNPYFKITGTEDEDYYSDDVIIPEERIPVDSYYRDIRGHWASEYAYIAHLRGYITDEEFGNDYLLDKPISREMMVRIMIRTLDIQIGTEESPFVDEADEYAKTAYSLYLLRGYLKPDGRFFNGFANTTRAEAATIVKRVFDYKTDRLAYIDKSVLEHASTNTLTTEMEIIDFFCSVNNTATEKVLLTTTYDVYEWIDLYTLAGCMYPEYMYSTGYDCTFAKNSGKFYIEFSYPEGDMAPMKQREAVEAKVKEIADEIRQQNLSKYSQIELVHDYLINHCKYDYLNYKLNTLPDSVYTAYGALINGSAVCQGYSAAFNLICRELGILSIGVTGLAPNNADMHMWNAVYLDGRLYFIDVTYDDPVPDRNREETLKKYFFLSTEDFKELGYKWDVNVVTPQYFFLAH